MTDHHDFSYDDQSGDHPPWDDAGHDLSHDHDFDGGHDFDGSPDFDGSHEFDGGHDSADFGNAHGDAEPPDAELHEPASHDADDLHTDPSTLDDPALLTPDPHGVTDISDLPGEEVFPPPVDIGPLPEPVDGFPWIDTGSLGLADINAALHEQDHTDPVRPEELAEYAGTDLPPGADPWAALADSDDPATAALAKWWQQN